MCVSCVSDGPCVLLVSQGAEAAYQNQRTDTRSSTSARGSNELHVMRPLASARRQFLLRALATAAVTQCPLAGLAALPSFSEYDAVQYKLRTQPPVPAALDAAALSPAEGLRLCSEEVTRLGTLVDTRSFEDTRLALRGPLFADFLGFRPGVRGYVGTAKPPAALLGQLPATAADPLEEVLIALKALDDFCIINRVIFFTQEDKDAVESLVAGGANSGTPGVPTKLASLEEPRALLAEVAGCLAEVRRMLPTSVTSTAQRRQLLAPWGVPPAIASEPEAAASEQQQQTTVDQLFEAYKTFAAKPGVALERSQAYMDADGVMTYPISGVQVDPTLAFFAAATRFGGLLPDEKPFNLVQMAVRRALKPLGIGFFDLKPDDERRQWQDKWYGEAWYEDEEPKAERDREDADGAEDTGGGNKTNIS